MPGGDDLVLDTVSVWSRVRPEHRSKSSSYVRPVVVGEVGAGRGLVVVEVSVVVGAAAARSRAPRCSRPRGCASSIALVGRLRPEVRQPPPITGEPVSARPARSAASPGTAAEPAPARRAARRGSGLGLGVGVGSGRVRLGLGLGAGLGLGLLGGELGVVRRPPVGVEQHLGGLVVGAEPSVRRARGRRWRTSRPPGSRRRSRPGRRRGRRTGWRSLAARSASVVESSRRPARSPSILFIHDELVAERRRLGLLACSATSGAWSGTRRRPSRSAESSSIA